MRRIFDIITSLVLLIILFPIFLLIMLAIKLTSKGPIFFKQKRIGKDNREFTLYKFRSMKVDAPNVATHLLNNPEKYITKVGKFLRKSSLDELPQLINIMKGNMTYVGPRPALYNQYDLTEMRTRIGVQTLLPGVTGWAQINGRDTIDLKDKVKFDEYYLHNKSIKFDIKILFLTMHRVVRADGVVEGRAETSTVEQYNKTATFL